MFSIGEGADVLEALPKTKDAGVFFNGKWKVNNTLSPAPPPREGMKCKQSRGRGQNMDLEGGDKAWT